MRGAIIGDIVGSVYEWNNLRSKDFPLFAKKCFFTDDSVMTIAVAKALMSAYTSGGDPGNELVDAMQELGRAYPDRGYGGRFRMWLYDENPKPYNSWGNGAAMRCSPAGFIADSADRARALGEATAAPTHNHPEGLKAAGLTAELIWRARHGESMEQLRTVADAAYAIPLLDEARPGYRFTESSQGTMPVALAAFFESAGFEDAIRNAISVGGDSDTIAAITGSISEAFWGVPEDIWETASTYLDERLRKLVEAFSAFTDRMNRE